jgi:hypothetical protein
MAIPLILSAFTHLFNPVGFPCLQPDEGIYMRRTMHILQGLGPQDPASRFDHAQVTTSSYDHPYFGTLFLASILGAIGYPSSLDISSSITNPLHSIEMLYLVPRVLMGILAVVDTFLIYKIAERRYNRNIALIASILFAVMPLSWLIRRVYLDTILMPFLLSSILFALYNINSWSNSNSNSNSNNRKNRSLIPILLSGILLGLAIFTKIPAVTMIPLVGFLVYVNNGKNFKVLGLWFIPVILIPLIWPAYSILAGQYDEWLNGVLWQGTQRQGIGIRSIYSIFNMDMLLFVMGLLGAIFAVIIKRDLFFLLWLIPFFIYASLIGWITYFHYILVLPAFCIAAANLIEDIPKRIIRTKGRTKQRLLSYIVISVIGIFGLISSSLLIMTNFFPSQFAAAAFVVQYVDKNNNDNNDVTIISGPIFSWFFKYIFGYTHVLSHYRDSSQPIQTNKVILIIDGSYRNMISSPLTTEDAAQIERLQKIYNSTDMIASYRSVYGPSDYHNYPYINSRDCFLYDSEVKANY